MTICKLLPNGMVAEFVSTRWLLKKFDPNEKWDSGWDVYSKTQKVFCAAAAGCFSAFIEDEGWLTLQECENEANILDPFENYYP